MKSRRYNWKHRVLEEWRRFSESELDLISPRDLVDKLQELYGVSFEQARQQVRQFYRLQVHHIQGVEL